MTNYQMKLAAVFTFLFLFVNGSVYAQSESNKDQRKQASVEEVFEKRDKNEDGKLEKSELIGLISNDFEKFDTDDDGFISKKELADSDALSSKGKRQRGKRQSGDRPDPAQMMEHMDSNKDGKLSKEEVRGPLARHFSKIDSNNDGFISKEELQNSPKPKQRGDRSMRH